MTVNSYNQKTNSTTVNPYFNQITRGNEQSLYDALIVENIKCSGIEVYFVPRTDTSIDEVFRESYKTFFNASYKIEVYVKNVDWDSGQGDSLTRFGFQQSDAVNLLMSRTRFNQLLISDRIRPTEGDLIYIGDGTAAAGYGTYPNSIYEITYVSNTPDHWPLGKWMYYDISCRLFQFSYEKFNTGTVALDTMPDSNSNDCDIVYGVNTAINEMRQSLINFDENNPFNEV